MHVWSDKNVDSVILTSRIIVIDFQYSFSLGTLRSITWPITTYYHTSSFLGNLEQRNRKWKKFSATKVFTFTIATKILMRQLLNVLQILPQLYSHEFFWIFNQLGLKSLPWIYDRLFTCWCSKTRCTLLWRIVFTRGYGKAKITKSG